MIANKANDYTVLGIQEIFEHINNFNYEEAFFLSSQLMERQYNGDTMFHEWVKSLAEFYSCNKRKEAIQLLEKIRPDKPENEIHFRIINSLMCFYREVRDKDGFIKNKEILYLNLHKFKNKEFLVKSIYNIANGFYTFGNYSEALKYAEEAIDIAKGKVNIRHEIEIPTFLNNSFNMFFSFLIMLKIMCLFYIGKVTEAENLKEEYLNYLKITGDLGHKEYLKKKIEEYYKWKEGEEC